MSGPIIVTPPTSLEPLAPNELPLGDLDRDRTTDAADAARWLRTMRIPVHTYAVIDDEHRGVGLPRRGWDYLVKTISPHCLRERYGLPVDPMPPERVPGLAALVDACLDVPTSYWRTFADAGFAFLLAENLGRLAKGWTGDVDGVPHRLVFLHRANGGYTGRLSDRLDGDGFPTATGFTVRAGRRVAIAWAWEPLTDVEFDAAGIVSFVRPSTGDRWSGRVDDAHDGFSTGTVTLRCLEAAMSPAMPPVAAARSARRSPRGTPAAGRSPRAGSGSAARTRVRPTSGRSARARRRSS